MTEIIEPKIKILLLGDSSAGKTCILQKFVDETFNPCFITTIGIDFRTKYMFHNDLKKKVIIWDTAGQERFRNITRAYYRGAMGMLLVFDITNRTSYENINRWIKEIKNNTSNDLEILLVGNKVDLEDKRQVLEEEGKNIAETLNITYIETSAKTGHNINEAFQLLLNKICDNMDEIENIKTQYVSISKPLDKEIKSNNCGCN